MGLDVIGREPGGVNERRRPGSDTPGGAMVGERAMNHAGADHP